METKELVAALRRVKPAVSSSDMVPAMQCLFFNGDLAMAWDDTVRISTECPLDVDGGVPAAELIGWLEKCSGIEVTVTSKKTADGETATFKCGRSTLKLPVIDFEEFQWEEQHDQTSDAIAGDDLQRLALGINRLMPAQGVDIETPNHLGLGVVSNGKGSIDLAATNEAIAMMQTVVCELPKLSFTMHPRFAAIFGKLTKEEEIADLRVADEWVEVNLLDSTSIWARVNDCGNFHDLTELGKRVNKLEFTALPEGFTDAISRAVVITKGEEEPLVSVKVLSRVMRLHAEGPHAKLDETLPVKGWQSMEAKLIPKLVAASLIDADEFALDPEIAIVFRNPDQMSICLTVVAN